MRNHKIHDTYIPHLDGQFRQATPVLFTGAGFSRDAKSIAGQDLPLPSELCKKLWSICFPGEEYEEGSSLADLFEDARLRHASKLQEQIVPLLTVDATRLPSYYSTILSMPWLRCYTLNIDDIEKATSRTFDLPRSPLPISATRATSLKESHQDDHSLDFIHLNGTLDDLPHAVTFSTLQYAERLSGADPWYINLVGDLLSRPIVFIGTSLDEPPLWQHLELRRQKGGRGDRELRPRSYLVTPSLPRARRALLAEFNTVWLPMTAEEFAQEVLSKLQAAARHGLSQLAPAASERKRRDKPLPLVSDLSSNPLRKTDYLLGQEPDWSDIQSGRAIERENDTELQGAIDRQLSSSGLRGLIVVTGTAGSGKSTSLIRHALSLTAKSHKVAWIDRDTDISLRDIAVAMRTEEAPDVLAIDDADVYGADLSPVIREIALNESRPLILAEIRSGRLDRAITLPQLEGVPVNEVSMRHLTDRDIGALLEVLDRENRLGVLKAKPRHEQEEAFRKQAGRQLLVAMYEATSGRKFEERAQNELLELEESEQFVYGLAAVATVHRFGLTRDEIVIATGDRSNSTLNVVDRLTKRHLIVPSRDPKYFRARHRVIARILVDELQKRGALKDILGGLMLVSAVKTQPNMKRTSRPYRMLRTFLNHDYLFRMLDAEQARNLYGSVEQLLHWEENFWLQRGSLEVEEGDIRLAENFLNQARSLAPDHPYVENEWAYLLFRKAIISPGSSEAPELVRDATETLKGLIDSTKNVNEHPYHVLGSQGLAWARRGIRNEDERAQYLRGLVGVVQEGLRKHPESDVLRQLENDLRREILSYSVPHHLRE